MAASQQIIVETVSAPTNIAVIKYWGKESVPYNTPINSSVSVTLDQDDLRSITTVAASRSFSCDRLWLNGKELPMDASNSHAKRFQKCVLEMRKLAGDRVDEATGEVLVKKDDWSKYHFHVVSRNTFPTAAGLASSAAGYACLVYALAKVLGVPTDKAGLSKLSVIARQGSGSACRSLFGGFVRWEQGTAAGGGEGAWSNSRAVQVASEEMWPELETLILVTNAAKKATGSTEGMERSVRTSPLLMHRATSGIVDERLSRIERAFKEKDFATFGELTMKDSNQFHATCLDSYPPIFYMNDTSKQVCNLVHAFNAHFGKVVAAYTFDAGPNAVIFVPRQYHSTLLAFMLHFFPLPSGYSEAEYSNRPDLLSVAKDALDKDQLPKGLIDTASLNCRIPKAGDVKMMYCTKVGPGPKKAPSECLVEVETGMPATLPREMDKVALGESTSKQIIQSIIRISIASVAFGAVGSILRRRWLQQ